jgi:hypothetical protein
MFANGAVVAASGNQFLFNTRTRIVNTESTDGLLSLMNFGQNNFTALIFGTNSTATVNSTNNAYPRLNRYGGSVYLTSQDAVMRSSNMFNAGAIMVMSNIILNTNGVLTQYAPSWKDLIRPPTTLSKGGTAVSRVALSPSNPMTVEAWPVGAYGDSEWQLNHDLAVTNAYFPKLYVEPHLHLSVTNLTVGESNVTFYLTYNWAPINSFFTNTVSGIITNTLTITNSYRHYIMNLGNITNNAASGTVSSIIHWRLTRLASATGDMATDDVRLHEIDLHYPVNRLGSTEPGSY